VKDVDEVCEAICRLCREVGPCDYGECMRRCGEILPQLMGIEVVDGGMQD